MTLKERLTQFTGSTEEVELQKTFEELAPSFLYGGYIKVREDYQISLLNGFSLCDNNDIRWIDDPRLQSSDLLLKTRKNVFKSECEWIYKPTKIRGERIWSFTRMDKV